MYNNIPAKPRELVKVRKVGTRYVISGPGCIQYRGSERINPIFKDPLKAGQPFVMALAYLDRKGRWTLDATAGVQHVQGEPKQGEGVAAMSPEVSPSARSTS